MAQIRPFQAIRPEKGLVDKIAALPYDVYSSAEAREIVGKNPLSFLKIDRAETQFPENVDIYSEQVYEKAADILNTMKESGELVQEETACFYIYELTMKGRSQRGLVCCASVDDYINNVIRKHENTRAEKEVDRIRHVETCSAHTGPIFLAYRSNEKMKQMIDNIVKEVPLYDFTSEDRVKHRVWCVSDMERIRTIKEIFAQMSHLYIADGHHRAASAVKVGLKCRERNPSYDGTEEFNHFLSVLFDETELKILDYNRVVHRVEVENLVEKIRESFDIVEKKDGIIRPENKGEIGMYWKQEWYRLRAKESVRNSDSVDGLDVSILQNQILAPLLGIQDAKTDERIQFVGGIRGLEELVRIVDQEKHAVAFAMYPTSMQELLAVADEGRLMPPKSTWFEPKLRSGIFVHEF